jgi:uncharacterized membrane-anchored protein YjiN (DUF445 family)
MSKHYDPNLIPRGSARIRLTDEKGKQRWKSTDEIMPTDQLHINPKTGLYYGMKGSPGRKSIVALKPASPVVAELVKRRSVALEQDEIFQATQRDPQSSQVLHEVMLGLIEETAVLKFEREEAERQGEATSSLSMRRVQALKAVADTWLKRKEQVSSNMIDLESDTFGALFGLISETFKQACTDSGLRSEMIDMIFAKFASALNEEWASEAKARMKRSSED